MDLKDCAKFANENKICFLATVDGDQPRVRGFMMWFADETGFYFHTGATKEVCRQLKKNPKIEVCFFAPSKSPGGGTMMRVAGEVKFIEDLKLKARLLEERPFLKAIVAGKTDDPLLVIFQIFTGEVHFWTMANNLRENEIERVKFGIG